MSKKLGARKRKNLGLMPKNFDYLSDELIDPDFYSVLKENGLDTRRKLDGSYWDKESQELWERWQAQGEVGV